MKFHLTVLSGSRTGLSREFDQSLVGLGRHPQSELQLHPEQDLDVSTRHAAIMQQSSGLIVRDLESANGTYVNGQKIQGDQPVHSGDVIQLGPNGPTIQLVIEGEPSRISAETKMGAGTPAPAGGSATARIRIEVARQTRSLRRTTIALLALLLLVAAGYFWQQHAYETRLERERAAMLAQVDSLTGLLGSMNISVAALRLQADSAQHAAALLKARIQAGGDPAELENYRRQLAEVLSRQHAIASANTLDAARVDSLNGNAIGLVVVQFPDDSVFTGTGFAVASDKDGAWLITNKHVVQERGVAASHVGVIFNHSNQQFQGEVVRMHDGEDLALIHVAVRGGTPIVKGLAIREAAVGMPVASIGFPLGLDLAGGGDWKKLGVAATVGVATVSRILPDLVQLDGYGATGASGSPIFDRDGEVVSILFGGVKESNGRIVYSLPVRYARELLQGVVAGY
ncbi:MAG: trypsin-like peptidase domain-containing protein [Gemmatimonadales bacterium]